MPDDQVYAGFSLHCSTPDSSQRVLEGVEAAAGKSGHSVKEYADVVYLGLKDPLNLNSCVCWLKRQSFGHEDFKLCLHPDEATAVDGLSTTMLPKNRYKS